MTEQPPAQSEAEWLAEKETELLYGPEGPAQSTENEARRLAVKARTTGVQPAGVEIRMRNELGQTILELLAALSDAEAKLREVERERENYAKQEWDVNTALAEADVPRSDGVDEPLYSQAHRVRLLRERAEAAEAKLREYQGWLAEANKVLGDQSLKLREYADRELLLLDVAQAARFEEECAPELRHDAKVRKLRALAALTRSNDEEAE